MMSWIDEHPYVVDMRIKTVDLENELAEKMLLPSMMLKPKIFIDGNKWCALFGENLQSGVAGFGDSPQAAYDAFDKSWVETLQKEE
jgi:hypothetical protein